MTREYALYLSYNRWLHEIPLDVTEYIAVAEATGLDPSDLEECWDEGDYPQDGEIFSPSDNL